MSPEAVMAWLSAEFVAQRNPERAIAMAAYMKNLFPFWGIPAPQQEQLAKRIYPQLKLVVDETWLTQTGQLLYHQSEREYHYFAVSLLRRFRDRLSPQAMSAVEHLLVTHSWWDTVDEIAAHIVGDLVRRWPTLLPQIEAYSVHDNLWLRRTAILHQLSYKQQTDRDRLFQYCTVNAASEEFFIRKAIGWALREYSKTDSEAVIEYVRQQRDRLSNLSKREALKRTPVDWREFAG